MRLAYAVPVLADVPGEVFAFHLKNAAECQRLWSEVRFITPHNICPYDRARRVAVTEAIDAGCDWLWFVDADTAVPPGGLALLMESMDRGHVISGWYMRRGYPYTCVWSKVIDGRTVQLTATDGVHEIDWTGMGCALINLRWLVSAVQRPWFQYGIDSSGVQTMEDLFFCRKVRQAGGVILGDARVRCGHLLWRELLDETNADELRARGARDIAESANVANGNAH